MKLKAFMLSLMLVAMMLPIASFAQNDNIIQDWNDENGVRDFSLTWAITNNSFGTSPLGSGLLVLTAVGAGYAVAKRRRNRKNGTMMLLALAMIVGMTGCRKKVVEPIVNPSSGGTTYTINLNTGKGSKVNVTGADVEFTNGDKLLVAHNGRYVGALTYNESESKFEGTITTEVADPKQKLYFYFLGNKIDVSTLTPGTSGSTSCTVNISDQTGYPALPVISFSASNEDFSGNGSYSAALDNKCSLMKFNVTTSSSAAICITGMSNKVTVDFSKVAETGTGLSGSDTDNGFKYEKEGEGVIKMIGGGSGEKWAIVLPQDALSAGTVGTAYTTDNIYEGNRPSLTAISANQYLNTGVAMTINTYTEPGTPLTFEAKTAGAKVRFTKGASLTLNNLEYNKYDGQGWKSYTYGTDITLANVGNKVSFRGNNAAYATGSSSGYYSTFSCDKDCYIYGNIMSLISSTDYANAKTLSANRTFAFLFYDNTHIVKHSSKALALPATTLASDCYEAMFLGCTGLTTAPALPATTLASGCYSYMFQGCTGLTTAPALPAETLVGNCYKGMFQVCTGLKTAPALPATTLASGCYMQMFYGCTGLTTAPALPALTLASSCYQSMFNGCTSLTSAPTLPATTLATSCYNGMFQGCTSLTTAPALPATTLQHSCYQNMFRGCTKLTTAPALPATTLESSCYGYMFENCTKLTTAPELPATTLVTGCYQSMFYGCTLLTSVTCLATSGIYTSNSTKDWLNGVAATGTFTKNASTPTGSGTSGQYWPINSADGIPSGWTVQDAN